MKWLKCFKGMVNLENVDSVLVFEIDKKKQKYEVRTFSHMCASILFQGTEDECENFIENLYKQLPVL